MKFIIVFLCFCLTYPAFSETKKKREDRSAITKLLDLDLEQFDLELPLVLHDSIIFVYSGKAKAVYLSGNFDNWNSEISLKEARENFWVCAIATRLKPGTYHYRFKVDGLWIPDPLNAKFEYDSGFVKLSVLNLSEEFIPNKRFPFWVAKDIYRFRYRSKNAESVYITGDFNNWNPFSHEMTYIGNQLFEIDLELKKGTVYIYSFVEDGTYKADDNNQKQFRNTQGQPVNVFYANRDSTAY